MNALRFIMGFVASGSFQKSGAEITVSSFFASALNESRSKMASKPVEPGLGVVQQYLEFFVHDRLLFLL